MRLKKILNWIMIFLWAISFSECCLAIGIGAPEITIVPKGTKMLDLYVINDEQKDMVVDISVSGFLKENIKLSTDTLYFSASEKIKKFSITINFPNKIEGDTRIIVSEKSNREEIKAVAYASYLIKIENPQIQQQMTFSQETTKTIYRESEKEESSFQDDYERNINKTQEQESEEIKNKEQEEETEVIRERKTMIDNNQLNDIIEERNNTQKVLREEIFSINNLLSIILFIAIIFNIAIIYDIKNKKKKEEYYKNKINEEDEEKLNFKLNEGWR
ncbi:MAG: hypothetical protein QXG86_02190 [Candidatus Woesearchaeota archaeon]